MLSQGLQRDSLLRCVDLNGLNLSLDWRYLEHLCHGAVRCGLKQSQKEGITLQCQAAILLVQRFWRHTHTPTYTHTHLKNTYISTVYTPAVGHAFACP